MSRLREAFKGGRKAFVAFVTAGDPSLDRTVELALELAAAGVSILELGVPFSDPLADGPVIQRASERALRSGATLAGVVEAARRIRERSGMGLLLFTYYNPLLRRGLSRVAAEVAEAGIDGVLVTDLPPEEAGEWLHEAEGKGLDTVFLASPTSGDERLARVASVSRGFVYAVSRTGVTGEREALSDDAALLLRRLRASTAEPVALGFGISRPDQVREASRMADGVVVGSALVSFLEKNPDGDLGGHVRWLMTGL